MSRLRTWAVPLACLLLALGLGAAALRTDRSAARQEDDARQRDAALSAATDMATVMLNLRADGADDGLDDLRAMATGDFAEQVDLLATTITSILDEGQVEAQGAVAAAGLERFDDDEATALVAARTIVRNAEIPGGEPRDFRISVDLSREPGGWRISQVEFLS